MILLLDESWNKMSIFKIVVISDYYKFSSIIRNQKNYDCWWFFILFFIEIIILGR